MSDEEESCIVSQFRQFLELDPGEIELLYQLEKDPRSYSPDELIAASGQSSDHLFTVLSGWACAERILPDGRRQVLDLFTPGHIIGLREIISHHYTSDFRALTDVVACPFPLADLHEVFEQAPRLGDLFFLVLAREQAILVERIINIGRRTAAERLAHLLVEIRVRTQTTSNRIEFPLTQTMIGDALSLSSVHISRTYQRLCDRGLIKKRDGVVEILDLEELIDYSGFERSYLEINSNWAHTTRPATA